MITASISIDGAQCPWCKMIHDTKCPLVKALEFHPDGSLKRVEFKSAGDFAAPIAYPSVPQFPITPQPQRVYGPGSGLPPYEWPEVKPDYTL
jgi:hypothetical protein